MTATLVVVALSLTACDSEHSESCEWEKKKLITVTPDSTKSKNAMIVGFEGKVGGSTGSRGGSSGSRSGGGGVKLTKPGSASGGSGSKPRYSKTNPAPMPKNTPGKGYFWSWDCD